MSPLSRELGDLFEVSVRSIRLCLLLLTVLGATVARAETWAPLVKDGQQFTLTAPATIRYGVDGKWTVVQRGIGSFWCSYNEIADPALGDFSKRCEILVVTPVVPVVITDLDCIPSSLWGVRFHDSPTALPHPHAVTYACANGKRVVQLYSDAEKDALISAVVRGTILTEADLVAWRKAQPVWIATSGESAFDASVRGMYAAPVVPVATLKVQPIAAGTRPYGTINAAGTGINKKGDVAVLTLCDGTKRLGQTNYYAVPSKGAGMYALCALVP